MPVNIHPDDSTKAKIVYMILNRKTEEALQNLSKFYNITPPEIVVGTIKGKRRSFMLFMFKKKARFTQLILISFITLLWSYMSLSSYKNKRRYP
jgi:hypothetical protein